MKEKILAEFDQLAFSRKMAVIRARTVLAVCLGAVIAVAVFSYLVVTHAMAEIKVVDAMGGYLPATGLDQERQFNALVQQTCASAAYFLNSFDRVTIRENRGRSYYYVSKQEADRVFARYQSMKGYSDALDRAFSYATSFERIESLQGNKPPYHLKFTALLTVKDDNAATVVRYHIRAEGDLITCTPHFPENVTGFFFAKLVQNYEPVDQDK